MLESWRPSVVKVPMKVLSRLSQYQTMSSS